ncbi:hypothetical protein L596_017533 [Steinernema carpocapsae]|uniref:Uncharacterized protein n=1 Tax=Steinernema carpocapsae TaxID=34508 RepID=A0A4U5N274_STECR|nr:hypothetical protein L596_017533 [Steinernema carpocapsae]
MHASLVILLLTCLFCVKAEEDDEYDENIYDDHFEQTSGSGDIVVLSHTQAENVTRWIEYFCGNVSKYRTDRRDGIDLDPQKRIYKQLKEFEMLEVRLIDKESREKFKDCKADLKKPYIDHRTADAIRKGVKNYCRSIETYKLSKPVIRIAENRDLMTYEELLIFEIKNLELMDKKTIKQYHKCRTDMEELITTTTLTSKLTTEAPMTTSTEIQLSIESPTTEAAVETTKETTIVMTDDPTITFTETPITETTMKPTNSASTETMQTKEKLTTSNLASMPMISTSEVLMAISTEATTLKTTLKASVNLTDEELMTSFFESLTTDVTLNTTVASMLTFTETSTTKPTTESSSTTHNLTTDNPMTTSAEVTEATENVTTPTANSTSLAEVLMITSTEATLEPTNSLISETPTTVSTRIPTSEATEEISSTTFATSPTTTFRNIHATLMFTETSTTEPIMEFTVSLMSESSTLIFTEATSETALNLTIDLKTTSKKASTTEASIIEATLETEETTPRTSFTDNNDVSMTTSVDASTTKTTLEPTEIFSTEAPMTISTKATREEATSEANESFAVEPSNLRVTASIQETTLEATVSLLQSTYFKSIFTFPITSKRTMITESSQNPTTADSYHPHQTASEIDRLQLFEKRRSSPWDERYYHKVPVQQDPDKIKTPPKMPLGAHELFLIGVVILVLLDII